MFCFLGVFGGLDLHGRDVEITWTSLKYTLYAGQKHLVLTDIVSWAVGDEIVVGSSRYNPWETETFRITSVSRDGLNFTLNEPCKYDHIGMCSCTLEYIFLKASYSRIHFRRFMK